MTRKKEEETEGQQEQQTKDSPVCTRNTLINKQKQKQEQKSNYSDRITTAEATKNNDKQFPGHSAKHLNYSG